MSKTRAYVFVGILLAGQAVLLWGADALRAQAKPLEAKPVYQYVGVQQTIARVNQRTGRIEVLSRRGDSRASLLVADQRPWEWREVRVREGPPDSREPGPREGDPPKGD